MRTEHHVMAGREREKEDYYSLTLGTRAAGAPSGRIEI